MIQQYTVNVKKNIYVKQKLYETEIDVKRDIGTGKKIVH